MFGWITLSVLINTGLGALAGLAIGLSQHIARDWSYLTHQWRYRRRIERGQDAYFEELRELEGYRPNPVTPQERAALPLTLAALAMSGAALVLALQAPDPRAIFAVFALIAVFRLAHVLIRRPIDRSAFRDAVVELAWLAFLAFGVDAMSSRLTGLGLTPGLLLAIWGLATALGLMALGVYHMRKGPPEDADRRDLAEWRTTMHMLVYGPPLAAALIAMFALAF